MNEFFSELKEEIEDFFEDFTDIVKKRQPRKDVKQKSVVIGGQLTFIRPAYLFAERIENLLKLLFGVSVLLSAVTASYVGFASLSGLVETLVNSIAGRVSLFIIGLSYLVVASWKILHLGRAKGGL